MDATTNKKTLAGVLVTLLVGSVFALAVPAAAHDISDGVEDASPANQVPTLSDAQDVLYHYAPDLTGLYLASPFEGSVTTGQNYDFTFANLPGTAGDSFTLQKPGANGPVSASGTRTAQTDTTTGHTGVVVSFPDVEVDTAGTWQLVGPTATYNFTIAAESTLSVTLDKTSVTYDSNENQFVLTITVTNSTGPVNEAVLSIDPAWGGLTGSETTGSNGRYIAIGSFPAAGEYTITAEKSLTGGSAAEITGTTKLTVNAADLRRTAVSESAFTGFRDALTYTFAYPESVTAGTSTVYDNVFRADDPSITDRTFNGFNLSVQVPGGVTYFLNDQSGTIPAGVQTLQRCDPAVTANCAQIASPLQVQFDTTDGEVTISPNAAFANADLSVWQSGTYNFRLGVTTTGSASSEYTSAWTFTPSAPESVNFQLEVDPEQDGTFVAQDNLMVREPTGGALQMYDLRVRLTGTDINDHPFCDFQTGLKDSNGAALADPEQCTYEGKAYDQLTAAERDELEKDVQTFLDSVSLTGDLLRGEGFNTIADADFTGTGAGLLLNGGYDPTSGELIIRNVVPSQNGTITLSATVDGARTFAIPVSNGGKIEVEPTTVTVDSPVTITVRVTTAAGDAVPTATVRLLTQAGAEVTTAQASGYVAAIGGTSGQGTGGTYTFKVEPKTVADLIAYATFGSGAAARHAYALIDVQPSHDLNVTLNVNQTMAGLRTPVILNATVNGEGVAVADVDIRFLTEAQVRDFVDNATLANGIRAFSGATGDDFALSTGSGVNNLYFNATLPPGTYSVLVCDAACGTPNARHDNVGNLPTFVVERYDAEFTPNRVASFADIEQNVLVNVTVTDANGNPVNGTLSLVTANQPDGDNAGTGAFATTPTVNTVTITNGAGSFRATGQTAGSIVFEFNPTQSGVDPAAAYRVDGEFSIAAPVVTVSPDTAPILETTVVSVTVSNFAGQGLAGREVRICGSSLNSQFPATTTPTTLTATQKEDCPNVAASDADGNAALAVTPTSLGNLYVYVNDTYTGTQVNVTAGNIDLVFDPASPVVGGTVNITTMVNGRGIGGIRVNVTGPNGTSVLSQLTDGSGRVVLPNLEEGNYTAVATRTGYGSANESFSVGQQTVTPPSPEAQFELDNLQVPSTATVGSGLTASADVRNTGSAQGTATVLLLVNGAQRNSQQVTLDAGEEQPVAFDFTPNQAGSYRVTIRLAGGETLAEKTVTVEAPEPTQPTTPTQPTQPTTPTEDPTEPTGTGGTPTEPTGVPGFELVALLGALGIALLAFRRRN